MIDSLLLMLFVLILTAKIVGSILEKIGLDSSLGEIMTGILFGPSLFNLVTPSSIEPFAIIGSVLILFIAGMKEENIDEIIKDKQSRKIGLSLLFLTAFVMGAFFYLASPLFGFNFSMLQSLVLAIAFSIIDLGVPVKVLISKGLINQPIGRITIRSAVINLVVGLFMFTIVSMFLSFDIVNIMKTFINIAIFIAIIIFLMFFLTKVSKFVLKQHIEEAEFSLAILLVLFLAYLTEKIGFSSVLGAFIAGQLIGRTTFAETRSFSDKVKSLSFGLFIPLFFVWFGLSININDVLSNFSFAIIAFVLYVSVRFIITYLFMKHYNFEMPAVVSSSMLSVDIESLIVLIIATRIGVFSDSVPIVLFAPSVFLSTLLIVILVSAFSKKSGHHAQ